MALMVSNRSQEEIIQLQAIQILGPVRDSLGTVLPMTFLYSLLLLTGTLVSRGSPKLTLLCITRIFLTIFFLYSS